MATGNASSLKSCDQEGAEIGSSGVELSKLAAKAACRAALSSYAYTVVKGIGREQAELQRQDVIKAIADMIEVATKQRNQKKH